MATRTSLFILIYFSGGRRGRLYVGGASCLSLSNSVFNRRCATVLAVFAAAASGLAGLWEQQAAAQGPAAAPGRCEQLEEGNVPAVLKALKRLRPGDASAKKAVQQTITYFETNSDRMRYASFRSHSFFVGSGVMEAGCKTIIGLRLKQSGMRWTIRGCGAPGSIGTATRVRSISPVTGGNGGQTHGATG